jgi:anaerobic magnesium-protoporphyrin IX monomethyl ester cyclase
MKILLVAPPGGYKATIPKPPLGLAYIAAYLEKKSSHDIKIIDMYSRGMSPDALMSEIRAFSPQIVGFSAVTPQINVVGSLAKTIKETCDKKIRVIVGGPHPSTVPERTLAENPYVDIAVFGEGEDTMLDLCNALDTGKSLSLVAGIAYRENGSIKTNQKRILIGNIDSIPFPEWHKLNMKKYLDFNYLFNKKAFPIITSRGCTGRCTFCDSQGVWSGKLRMRSAGNIVDEMSALKSTYGVNHIVIVDDNFTINKKRAELICSEIESRDLKITWECNGRVDRVNMEMLDMMKKAGCIYIAYGIESGSQEILDYTKKNITLEQIITAVKLTKESGMRAGGFVMMGFPPETEEDIKKTVELVKELDLDWVSELSILVPYPGTEIYDEMKMEGLLIREDWDKYYKVFSNEVPVESEIKTRYIDNKRLLQLKVRYDKDIASHMYKKVILQHLKRLDRTTINFIRNPVSFIKTASRTVSGWSKSI